MDHQFTSAIRRWLDTPPEKRDLQEGAMLLLRLNGNRILYDNIMRDPVGRAPYLEHQLQRQYDFRVLDLTHEQVSEMDRRAILIADRLDLEDTSGKLKEPQEAEKEDDRLLGRRPDHDDLPDEIKALYLENRSLLQSMRELHLRLRSLTLVDHPCPDSERFPFLRDLIAYDKRLHTNWAAYDAYRPENSGPHNGASGLQAKESAGSDQSPDQDQ